MVLSVATGYEKTEKWLQQCLARGRFQCSQMLSQRRFELDSIDLDPIAAGPRCPSTPPHLYSYIAAAPGDVDDHTALPALASSEDAQIILDEIWKDLISERLDSPTDSTQRS
ncbi:hypothetical protein EIP91_000262 [Steccherinum ochraceum]|uniref:Uncharacterized protein n=1 Tax=Steccherinum ochraceum TaxID=92696 RepID=A0A4R0RGF2_9APHY|nr:hypothetical protein EIP91_000262 [Steccherinum ochraceum]